jgi:hypothetical protein
MTSQAEKVLRISKQSKKKDYPKALFSKMRCCVEWCQADIGKGSNGPRVPRDIEERKKWFRIIRPKFSEMDLTKKLRACSSHFHEDAFTTFTAGGAMRKRLVKGALPFTREKEQGYQAEKRRQLEEQEVDLKRAQRMQGRQANLTSEQLMAELAMSQDIVEERNKRIRTMNETNRSTQDELQACRVECEKLRAENIELKKKVTFLEENYIKRMNSEGEDNIPIWMNFNQVIETDENVRYYIGLANIQIFLIFLGFCFDLAMDKSYNSSVGRNMSIDFRNAITLTIMRLRQAFGFKHVAYLFKTSTATSSRTFRKTLKLLKHGLAEMNRQMWTPTRNTVLDDALPCFRENYPDLGLVFDCTDHFLHTATNHELQKVTYSHYKHHNTAKVLIGMSPAGNICFVSLAYGGKISDRQIVEESGALEELWEGATVMADKGFLIEETLKARGMKLAVPPLLQKGTQFSNAQLYSTRSIAAVRIHIERAIKRGKTFKLITNTIPVTMIPNLDDIVFVCFLLTNFMGNLVHLENQDED